jgi:hypothetical protein
MEELRKVFYTAHYEVNELNFHEPIQGFFHRFGDDINFNDGNPLPLTIGIVEDTKTGQVYKVPVDKFKFDNYQPYHKRLE